MKLTPRQLGVITDTVSDLFFRFAVRLLGRWHKGPQIYFDVLRDTDPSESLEGLFRYTMHMLYGPGVAIDDEIIKQLSEVTANYIEAERLKTINRIKVDLAGADSWPEAQERLHAQIKSATSYMDTLAMTEGRIVQAQAERAGIQQLGASIGVEDPTVVFFSVRDHRLCKHCNKMYSDPLQPRKPIPYKLSQLQQGYFKPKEWDGVTPFSAPLHPNCFSEDTEVLTMSGWKLFQHTLPTDQYLSVNISTGHMEYVPAIRSIAYPYEGKLVHFRGKTVDLLVTEGHSHPIYRRVQDGHKRSFRPEFVSSLDLLQGKHERYLIKAGTTWHGTSADVSIDGHSYRRVDLAVFWGYWLSEGYVIKAGKSTHRVYVCQQKHSDHMWSDLRRIFPHKNVTRTSTRISFALHNVNDREMLAMLLPQGYSFQKYVPDLIKASDTTVIRHFLDAFRLGDGTTRLQHKLPGQRKPAIERTYCTSSTQLASDIGELILKLGKSPSYRAPGPPKISHFRNGTYTSRHTCWSIRENNGGKVRAHRLNIQAVPYKGWVYDVELARNNTLFVRRNGKVMLSGNCRCSMSMVPPNFTIDGNGVIKFHSLGYDYYSDYHGMHKAELPVITKNQGFTSFIDFLEYHRTHECDCCGSNGGVS